MAKRVKRPVNLVVGEARRALRMTQSEFGYAVGSSHRSAVRWDAGQAEPGEHHLRRLVTLLHPVDRALAAEVADLIDETLVSLGLEAAPAPPAPPPPSLAPIPPAAPPPPRPRASDLVDILVLAAVELTGRPPAEVRPLLHAVFKRGHEVGLSMEEAAKALAPAEPAKRATAK